MKSFPETPLVLRTKHAHLAAVLHRAPGKRLVILCHGFGGNKMEAGRLFVLTARALQKAGINALRFDFAGSGDSSGLFSEMTPNTQIRDALEVLAWAQRRYTKIAFLGLSFGGATTICASQQARRKPDALLTWSSVPSLRWWNSTPPAAWPREKNPLNVGPGFVPRSTCPRLTSRSISRACKSRATTTSPSSANASRPTARRTTRECGTSSFPARTTSSPIGRIASWSLRIACAG
jgi:pimeloyl-ACP methyl ester carboxylesterase